MYYKRLNPQIIFLVYQAALQKYSVSKQILIWERRLNKIHQTCLIFKKTKDNGYKLKIIINSQLNKPL